MSARLLKKHRKQTHPCQFSQKHQFHLCSSVIQWDKSIQRNTDPLYPDTEHTDDLVQARVTTFTIKAHIKSISWLNEKGLLGFSLCFQFTTRCVIHNNSYRFANWILQSPGVATERNKKYLHLYLEAVFTTSNKMLLRVHDIQIFPTF